MVKTDPDVRLQQILVIKRLEGDTGQGQLSDDFPEAAGWLVESGFGLRSFRDAAGDQ
jgi:hypothetical protein